MSSIYLFRHGQAGLRDNYDTLSGIGRRQTRLLGDLLAGQSVSFGAFFTGNLQRQKETAAEIFGAYQQAGIALPEPSIDPLWNEFDLSSVYEGIAPQLAAADPIFRREYETLTADAANRHSTVHRRWTPADVTIVRAWIEGRYTYAGESWADFKLRIAAALDSLSAFPGQNIAISTSATPIGVWLGLALHLEDRFIMRAAGALHNSSFSVFRVRDGELHLSSFNNIPHITDPALKTFR